MKHFLITAALCLICAAAAYTAAKNRTESLIGGDIASIIKESQADQSFIEKVPIYEDYADAQKEETLRKYLFNEHYAAVKKPAWNLSSAPQRYPLL